MKNYLIYANIRKDPGLVVTEKIKSFLEGKGEKVYTMAVGPDWKESRENVEAPDLSAIDVCIALGGDGTVLQATRAVTKPDIKIIGVNMGNLGYITEAEPDNIEAALERIVNCDYTSEHRMMLSGVVSRANDCTYENEALNDIVISRNGPMKIVNFKIYVNGSFFNDYHADGVIISTPTGSTGYNLSVGGPLIDPGAELIMITPISPHSLNQRSIILSPDSEVEIVCGEMRNGGVQTLDVSFDGNESVKFETGDRVKIVRAKRSVEFIKLNKANFMEILRLKMRDH